MEWLEKPPLSAIVLCDNEPINKIYGVIKWYLNLKEHLKKSMKGSFLNDNDETINELLRRKYQILVSVDEHANIYNDEEIQKLEEFCVTHDIEFIKSVRGGAIIAEGFAKAQHYGDVFIHAWGLTHLLSDVELSGTDLQKVTNILPSSPHGSILCLARKKEDHKYHLAVLDRGLVSAMNLVSVDNDIYPVYEKKILGIRVYKESKLANPPRYEHSFHDFCVGIAYRIKKARGRLKEFSL